MPRQEPASVGTCFRALGTGVVAVSVATACAPARAPATAVATTTPATTTPATTTPATTTPATTTPSDAHPASGLSATPTNGTRSTAPPPLDASWGTADPFTLVRAAPDRRWMVVCQARRDTNGDGAIRVDVGAQGQLSGDALDGFVIDEPGPGFRVESFVGSDPDGRFIAFVRDGRLVLRDTTTRVDTELPGADLRDDSSSFTHPRVLSFDPKGRRILYLTGQGPGARIVVRELATGAESAVDPGPGELWRADFDGTGDSVVVRVVTADTNHDGKIGFPVRPAERPSMRCTGPLPRFASWERPGDDPEWRVAPASGGTAVSVPGLVTPFGAGWLERDADGALSLVALDGKRTSVADKSCEARLVHADPARHAVIFTCLDKKGHAEARLMKGPVTKALGFALTAAVADRWMTDFPRLVPLHPGGDAVLVDLENGAVEALSSGDRILATADVHALVLRGKALVLHDLGGKERAIPGEVAPFAHVEHEGPLWYVPPFVVDLARGEALGNSDARALAIAMDGSLLVATPSNATHLAVGPLRWKAPSHDETPKSETAVPIAGGPKEMGRREF